MLVTDGLHGLCSVSLFSELCAIRRVSINELCECVISRALLVHVSLFNELYDILLSINEICEYVIYF